MVDDLAQGRAEPAVVGLGVQLGDGLVGGGELLRVGFGNLHRVALGGDELDGPAQPRPDDRCAPWCGRLFTR